MNQEKSEEDVLEKNIKFPIVTSDVGEKLHGDKKDKGKKGMGLLRADSKRSGAAFGQCFSDGNFTTQYEDECPVNYSLKYSETESCKGTNKCDATKKKFKNYSDYAETDLDQPTDFSLKYAEKTYEEENKNSAFNYYANDKVKFKEYTDYIETDLDQPTDFTLKYRESAEEDVKNLEFNFYENEDRKAPTEFSVRKMADDASCERMPDRYAPQDETPLMFSRSSSMNSLSSFVHITQSIPDDRSSIVSDFSRMTSGVISPSELPDSPTQTAPSSPKRNKPSATFPAKVEFVAKQSVFEDDVATYKQEDTPVEFSRATSLSSLNLENPVKSDFVIKSNPGSSSTALLKEESQNSIEAVHSEFLKHQVSAEKLEHEKGKFELASVLEVDENLFADCISIDIQINCRKTKPHHAKVVMASETNFQTRQNNGSQVKPTIRLRFPEDNRKGYSYEMSDDAVRTYDTEGTPANVSYAGSHSDLSALSMSSGVPHAEGGGDGSFAESFFSSDNQSICLPKDTLKNKMKLFNESNSAELNISKGMNGNIFVNEQPQLDYLRKDQQLTAKDETSTFAVENSPRDFSIRSSLSDLTVNVMDSSLTITRVETCEEPSSQMLSPLRNVSPQSPSSVIFEEVDEAEKGSKVSENDCMSESEKQIIDSWALSNEIKEPTEKNLEETIARFSKLECFDFDSNLPLTPFEEALLEECIRLGMPQKKKVNPLKGTHLKFNSEVKTSECKKLDFVPEKVKCWNEKKISGDRSTGFDSQVSLTGTRTPNCTNGDNLDFDSSEPLTPFEEVLLEQCIRLGMPQKKNIKKLDLTNLKYLDEGIENFSCNSSELITPFETVLLEQCIRLGMPQKKNQKKVEGSFSCEESQKGMSSLSAHLNRLKLNAECERERLKCEGCHCGKRHGNKKKNMSCRKPKIKQDHCPG